MKENFTKLLRYPMLTCRAGFACFWSIVCISGALFVYAITRRRKVPLAMARRLWGPGLLRAAGARLVVQGAETVRQRGPFVFAMNHQSMLDIPAAFTALPQDLIFAAKKELLRIPFLGWYMRAMGMIFVDRRDPRQAVGAMKRGGAQVLQGSSVLVFPEGTYRGDGRIGAFKKGAARLAIEAGVPIVPMAITGSAQVLNLKQWEVRPGDVRIAIGQPIPVAGLSLLQADALTGELQARIADLFHSLAEAGNPAALYAADPPLPAALIAAERLGPPRTAPVPPLRETPVPTPPVRETDA